MRRDDDALDFVYPKKEAAGDSSKGFTWQAIHAHAKDLNGNAAYLVDSVIIDAVCIYIPLCCILIIIAIGAFPLQIEI